MAGLLADVVALTHAAVVVLVVVGGLLGLRWPGFVLPHLAVVIAVAGVAVVGADCPLTTVENRLRAAAGEPTYGGGFLAHYLVEPALGTGITPMISAAMHAVAAVPNALVVAIHLRQARRPARGGLVRATRRGVATPQRHLLTRPQVPNRP